MESFDPVLRIRDPYVFEFWGVKSNVMLHESDLEDQLLDNLQEFLLGLGHGFCFEARQKRILIAEFTPLIPHTLRYYLLTLYFCACNLLPASYH
jgi:predicted nuclease of restriction endonuclease-like (RecB) superfamily